MKRTVIAGFNLFVIVALDATISRVIMHRLPGQDGE